MNDLQSVINELKKIAISNNEIIERGATPEELTSFRSRYANFSSYSLPSDLATLLSEMDGYEFNGLLLYGTKQSSDPHASMMEMIEQNDLLREADWDVLNNFMSIGRDSTGVLGYDHLAKQWQFRDRIGLDRIDPYDSLADLLADEIPKIDN